MNNILADGQLGLHLCCLFMIKFCIYMYNTVNFRVHDNLIISYTVIFQVNKIEEFLTSVQEKLQFQNLM